MIALAWCMFGLAALVAGSELLVRAGSRLATQVGIPPILVGLTVVAVGTSTPELAVGIEAASQGTGSLAIGNIAGTNTFNILFILGLSAMFMPLALEMRTLRIDLPVMTAAAVALTAMAWDGMLTRMEGAILVAAGLIYTVVIIRGAKQESQAIKAEFAHEYAAAPYGGPARAASSFAILVLAIVVIVVGADWLVYGAVETARAIGFSDAFIGLTIVAVGTSSPELVTTIVSTLRQDRDIAVGNLLGSSVYNIVFILGLTLLVPPEGIGVEPMLIRSPHHVPGGDRLHPGLPERPAHQSARGRFVRGQLPRIPDLPHRLPWLIRSRILDADQGAQQVAGYLGRDETETVMTDTKELTSRFRHVRLLLAREKGHPSGDRKEGYDLLVPLDADSRLDAAEWKAHQTSCRVRKFHAGGEDRIGLLRRKPAGQWYFDYAEGESDDEIGFRLGEERFVTGEYVSVGRGAAQRTYQIARVEKP